MRRWISTLLTALMVVNVIAWPTDALAETYEHDRETIQLADQGSPVGALHTHCNHGCAGHCGHHFQFQASSFSYQPALPFSASAISAASGLSPQHIPTLPFRPPSVA